MKTTDYVPVPCADHSRYELAVMHRDTLHLTWKDAGLWHNETVLPLDVETRAGEEFLIARDRAGHTLHIRLDRIRHCTASCRDAG